jgi:hypothetical protein
MKKTFVALAVAGTLGLATLAAPTRADAGCWGWGCGAAVGLGVITGIAVGSAIANANPAYPAYAPAPGYVAYPGYGAAYPVACPGGYWARQQWTDAYGYVHWSRPRFFCPGP